MPKTQPAGASDAQRLADEMLDLSTKLLDATRAQVRKRLPAPWQKTKRGSPHWIAYTRELAGFIRLAGARDNALTASVHMTGARSDQVEVELVLHLEKELVEKVFATLAAALKARCGKGEGTGRWERGYQDDRYEHRLSWSAQGGSFGCWARLWSGLIQKQA